MTLTFLLALAAFAGLSLANDVTITVQPFYVRTESVNKLTNFVPNDWNSLTPLTRGGYFDACKSLKVRGGRWLWGGEENTRRAPQDPSRPGFADPNYFNNLRNFPRWSEHFYNGLKYFGNNLDAVHSSKHHAKKWPAFMLDKNVHGGILPYNLKAAGEFEANVANMYRVRSQGRLPLPKYWEPINEPDGLWKEVSWKAITDFHKEAADAIHKKVPGIKVGGPTYTQFITTTNRYAFKHWGNSVRPFLDMAFRHLDYFSFHWYRDVKYAPQNWTMPEFNAASPSRTLGLLDLIQAYAQKQHKKPFPISISEYGFGGIDASNKQIALPFRDFGYVDSHYFHTMLFMKYRGILWKPVAYLSDYADWEGQASISYSLFDKNKNRRKTALAFYLYNKMTSDFQYLLSLTDHKSSEQQVVQHTFLDKKSGNVFVLAKNYGDNRQILNVKLPWSYSQIDSSCVIFNKYGDLSVYSMEENNINSNLWLRPHTQCLYMFVTAGQTRPNQVGQVKERTIYGEDMTVTFRNGRASSRIMIPAQATGVKNAVLRFTISTYDQNVNPIPNSVFLNGNQIKNCKNLKYSEDKQSDRTFWVAFECNIQRWRVRWGENTVIVNGFNGRGNDQLGTAAMVIYN